MRVCGVWRHRCKAEIHLCVNVIVTVRSNSASVKPVVLVGLFFWLPSSVDSKTW